MSCNCSGHGPGHGQGHSQGNTDWEYEYRLAVFDMYESLRREQEFLSLGGNQSRRDCIVNLRALAADSEVIVDLAKKMAEAYPWCEIVLSKPKGHFFGPFEAVVYEELKGPLLQAVADLEANDRSPHPDPSVDFRIACELDAICYRKRVHFQ
ncbi:hypothetical protein N7457_004073 [Penicillium paradoxum]|uniref:uncharacterized protein n=1 Tax=Penicillium paradoxum TaxID=176176 RepID=UPI0025487F6B|nr:uncharacterized protein N7457_004073 [Penicillium paradoxum]KAJ5782299.1 hypothetical protein N7457_004073 [Penicillium paradoxum]